MSSKRRWRLSRTPSSSGCSTPGRGSTNLRQWPSPTTSPPFRQTGSGPPTVFDRPMPGSRTGRPKSSRCANQRAQFRCHRLGPGFRPQVGQPGGGPGRPRRGRAPQRRRRRLLQLGDTPVIALPSFAGDLRHGVGLRSVGLRGGRPRRSGRLPATALRGAGHDYSRQRAIAGMLPERLIRMGPAEVKANLNRWRDWLEADKTPS